MDNFLEKYTLPKFTLLDFKRSISIKEIEKIIKELHHKKRAKSRWFSRESLSSVQLLSRVRHFATPWIAAHQASLSITNSRSSLRLTSIESVMPSSHLILCRPLLLLPPIPPSIRAFSNESTLHMRWPKYWSFSLSISPSNEYPGLISFRMDFFPLHFCCMIPTLTSSKIFYLIALCLVLPNPHPSFINSQWF